MPLRSDSIFFAEFQYTVRRRTPVNERALFREARFSLLRFQIAPIEWNHRKIEKTAEDFFIPFILLFFGKRVDHERITAEFVFMCFLFQADCCPRNFPAFRIFQHKMPESFAVHLRSASDPEFNFGIFREKVS